MTREGAIAQLRAKLAFSDDPGSWSTAPTYGKPHDEGDTCWCMPVRDEVEPRIIIHNPSH